MANNKSEIKVKSLHKALMVLDCFAEKQPLSITEISEKLGLYKSNVYDILSTLCAMGYLDRSTESSKFYLGKKIVVLGRMASDRYSFKNIASPYLHQLANEAGEIAYLTVPIGYQLYYMDTAAPGDAMSSVKYPQTRSARPHFIRSTPNTFSLESRPESLSIASAAVICWPRRKAAA